MAVKLISAEKKKYRIAFWYEKKHYAKIIYGNKKLALEYQAKMRHQLAEGNYFPSRKIKNLTIQELGKRFLKECHTFKKSAHKVAIYVKGISEFFKGKKIKDIEIDDVAQFREHLNQKMTPVSVNHYHRVLRRMINWAIQRKLHRGENPASCKYIKLANEKPFWRTNYLNETELRNLLDVAEERLAPIILCAALTGMRLSEIRRMKKEHVDLNRCQIKIPESKNGECGYIPIPETLYETLAPIMTRLPDTENFVCDFRNFERMWKRARKKAGLDMHFHDLRHTYGSHLMMNSGNYGAVQALLRHKSPAMTQRYAHLAPNFLRKTALTLDGMFQNEKPVRKPIIKTNTDEQELNPPKETPLVHKTN